MGQLASDDFNRADNINLGVDWSPSPGADPCRITSNTVRAQTVDLPNAEHYDSVVWPADQYSQVRLAALTTVNTRGGGVCVRYGAADMTAYSLFAHDTGLLLWRWVAGTPTSLGTSAVPPIVNDVLRLEATGTTIRALVNGVERISVVDSTIATGSAGIMFYTDVLANSQVDDWAGGDLASGLPVDTDYLMIFTVQR